MATLTLVTVIHSNNYSVFQIENTRVLWGPGDKSILTKTTL